MTSIVDLHESLQGDPYSVPIRQRLIQAYEDALYPDLAAGEAYIAILLVDEITDESGEYHDEAFETALRDAAARPPTDGSGSLESDLEGLRLSDTEAIEKAQNEWLPSLYEKLVGNLIECGCLKSAYEYYLRSTKLFPPTPNLKSHHQTLLHLLTTHFHRLSTSFDPTTIDLDSLPDRVLVRRDLYPWNTHEPDRYSPSTLSLLNSALHEIAPDLEVRATHLPSLTPGSTSTIPYHTDRPRHQRASTKTVSTANKS